MSAWSMYQCCSQLALQSREPDFVLLPHFQLHASLWTAPPSRHLHTANSTGTLLENSRRALAEVLLSATRLQPHLDGRKMDVGEQVLTSLSLCSRFSQAIFWHLVVGQETPEVWFSGISQAGPATGIMEKLPWAPTSSQSIRRCAAGLGLCATKGAAQEVS